MAKQKLISAHTHTHRASYRGCKLPAVFHLAGDFKCVCVHIFVCGCLSSMCALYNAVCVCVCVCVCVSVIMQVWEVMFWYPHTHQSSSWCSSVKTHTQPCGFTPPPSLVSGSRGLSAPLAEGSPYSQLQRVQKQQGWITQGTRQRLWWSKQSC